MSHSLRKVALPTYMTDQINATGRSFTIVELYNTRRHITHTQCYFSYLCLCILYWQRYAWGWIIQQDNFSLSSTPSSTSIPLTSVYSARVYYYSRTFGSFTVRFLRFWVAFWDCADLWNSCISSTPWGTPAPSPYRRYNHQSRDLFQKKHVIRFFGAVLPSAISWIPLPVSTRIAVGSLSFAVQQMFQYGMYSTISWLLKYCKGN